MRFVHLVTAALRGHAVAVLALRAGVVGANFAVMLLLTWHLGLAAFGTLIFVWSAAMVASAVISIGGPLALLRVLSQGAGLHWYQLTGIVAAGPAFLCALCWAVLHLIWPEPQWFMIFQVAFWINALACMASIMRALGSVQMSMVLRDAAPFCVLGISAAVSPDQSIIGIMQCWVFLMMVLGGTCTLWCLRRWHVFAASSGQSCLSASLWGTSILGMVTAQIDLIVGGAMMGAEALGLYAFLRRIANLVALPVTVATWVSAKPVAASYGSGDLINLQRASAQASRIAWFPALTLSALCAIGLLIASLTPFLHVTQSGALAFCILIGGAIVQAYFAAGFTVATLGEHAQLCVVARVVTFLSYTSLAAAFATSMTPISNAATYVIAMSLGSVLVWSVLSRDLGVDTSARAVRRIKGGAWKIS